MWKDFFSFNKRERFTILTLTILIVFIQVLLWTSDYWVKYLPESLEKKVLQKKELEAFRDSISKIPATFKGERNTYQRKTNAFSGQRVQLAPFNPNTADSITLTRLGLRSYVVRNILKYRSKGGLFRKPEDFGRIYGMDSEVFHRLMPYIKMEQVNAFTQKGVERTSEKSPAPASVPDPMANDEAPTVPANKSETPSNQATPVSVFELNAADTTLLQQLKGVGPITANRITRYRAQLGGFYSMNQLVEIKGLYPETLARLQSMMKIDPERIMRINANKASLEKLRAHPYISFYQAKVIVELRKSRGSIRSIEDLKDFKEFTPEDRERLKWYLSFE
jgi:DNA uptake protein ComE-like DNA-binding protein